MAFAKLLRMRSVPTPAEYLTTKVTGLSGHSSARAVSGTTHSAPMISATTDSTYRDKRKFICVLPGITGTSCICWCRPASFLLRDIYHSCSEAGLSTYQEVSCVSGSRSRATPGKCLVQTSPPEPGWRSRGDRCPKTFALGHSHASAAARSEEPREGEEWEVLWRA